MRLAVIVALVGCIAPRDDVRAPVATPPIEPPKSERAEAEPWRPPPAGKPIRPPEEIILSREGRLDRMQQVEESRSDLWDPCVRDVLQARDPAERNVLGDALTGYVLTCERTERKIAFEPPQGGRSQAPQTVIGIRGLITADRIEIELRVAFWIARVDPFERITIIAGPLRWTSPRLDVDHDPANHEAAAIPFAPSLARVVRRMLDEPDASIRFETANSYDEVIVTDQTKTDMRVMLDALNL